MSSEGTLSDGVGEEVMLLAYGGMDEESSPSSSERRGEGVGRQEIGGGEIDGIPPNILEVNNEVDRCYDIRADIISEVRQYETEMGMRDSLAYLVDTYDLSSSVLIRPAGVEERAYSAPRDHWMPVYGHYLAAGLRFPLPEPLVGLLLEYSIGLT
ncbi:hypothetical protein SLA2020_018730 [Shorea laevis]